MSLSRCGTRGVPAARPAFERAFVVPGAGGSAVNECAICIEDTGFHIGGRCNPPRTVEACDAQLREARLRLFTSLVAEDLRDCHRQQRRLDWLLEVRFDLVLVPA